MQEIPEAYTVVKFGNWPLQKRKKYTKMQVDKIIEQY